MRALAVLLLAGCAHAPVPAALAIDRATYAPGEVVRVSLAGWAGERADLCRLTLERRNERGFGALQSRDSRCRDQDGLCCRTCQVSALVAEAPPARDTLILSCDGAGCAIALGDHLAPGEYHFALAGPPPAVTPSFRVTGRAVDRPPLPAACAAVPEAELQEAREANRTEKEAREAVREFWRRFGGRPEICSVGLSGCAAGGERTGEVCIRVYARDPTRLPFGSLPATLGGSPVEVQGPWACGPWR